MSFLYRRIVISGYLSLLGSYMLPVKAAILPTTVATALVPSFATYLSQAQDNADKNQPEQSLLLYQKALTIALDNKNPVQARVARFGIGKMQLWLEMYAKSEAIYRSLYSEPLSPADKQIALDGLVRSLNYQDRPKEALQLVAADYVITNPDLVIALAQAHFSAGEADQADRLLEKYKPLLQSITKNSVSDRQLTRLYAQIHSEQLEKARQAAAMEQLMKQTKQNLLLGFFSSSAVTQVEQNDPEMALLIYQKLLADSLINNQTDGVFSARFGIAKMQLWLGQYPSAESTYRDLYHEKLNPVDQQVALDGLIRAINYQDRPKEALKLIPKAYAINNPGLVIAIAQVYVSLDSISDAQMLLKHYETLLQTLPQHSSLDKQLDKLKRQIRAASASAQKKPAPLNPHDPHIAALVKKGELAFNSEASGSENPQYKQALAYYYQALYIAKTYRRPNRVILFRIGAVYLSLGDFRHALPVYTELLNQPLDKADYEVALNGYVQSLSGRDRPMMAWRSIPKGFVYHMLAMVVSASEAALWSNWPYKSMALLQTYDNLVKQIAPESRLGYRLDDVLWQSRLGTAINTVGFTSYYEKDSDDFTIQRNQASYSHRFGVPLNTSMFWTKSHYAVPGLQSVSGNRFTAQADGWFTDSLTYVANVAPASYLNWSPVLAKAGLFFAPNDFYSLNVLASKDIVESVPSLLNKISVNSLAGSGILFPAYRMRVAAGVLSDHFSDNNTRNGFNLRPVVLLFPDLGLYGEFYWRSYSNSLPNSPFYFSSEKYEETRVTLKLNRHADPVWRYYINAGLGQQRINQDPKTPTKFFEAGLRGPWGKHLVIDAGYGYNSATGGSATGFARQYGIVNITWLI